MRWEGEGGRLCGVEDREGSVRGGVGFLEGWDEVMGEVVGIAARGMDEGGRGLCRGCVDATTEHSERR